MKQKNRQSSEFFIYLRHRSLHFSPNFHSPSDLAKIRILGRLKNPGGYGHQCMPVRAPLHFYRAKLVTATSLLREQIAPQQKTGERWRELKQQTLVEPTCSAVNR